MTTTNLNEWEKRFDEAFSLTNEEVEWFGDGHFCRHHPDDPSHGEACYTHPILRDIKSFISQLLQESRQEGAAGEKTRIGEMVYSMLKPIKYKSETATIDIHFNDGLTKLYLCLTHSTKEGKSKTEPCDGECHHDFCEGKRDETV